MNRIIYFSIVLSYVLNFNQLQAQITIILQPGLEEGKDAMVWAAPNLGMDTINYGSDDRLLTHAWTNSSVPDTSRSLIEFDLSGIPAGTIIVDARLNIYNNPTTDSFDGQHSSLTGPNSSVIRRITQAWDESTVKWVTKPAFVTLNEVLLDSSTTPNEDFLNIDVTQLVQDMVDNPSSSFGFILQLQTEVNYRALVFASSDHLDAALHPKLVITYLPDSVNCITLKPNADEGKDAMVWAAPNLGKDTINNGIDDRLLAHAWTNSSVPDTSRSLIEFNLSSIPADATIIDARLNLYNNPTTSSFDGQHSSLTGPNSSVIRRITQAWDESTVTWNTKPEFVTLNEVLLEPSTSPNEDFQNIDVTQLIKDMIDNPSTSFGFMLQLQAEEYYRALVFASSDHLDADLHPELRVCYVLVSSIPEVQQDNFDFNIYPNPASQTVNIKLSRDIQMSLEIINSHGQVVRKISSIDQKETINISGLAGGTYIIRLVNKDIVAIKKLIIK